MLGAEVAINFILSVAEPVERQLFAGAVAEVFFGPAVCKFL
jgi:hypothetical protein